MFDHEDEKPLCLEIAANMLRMSVDELEEKHEKLFKRLLSTRHYLRMFKPYGELASTQVVASIIANYFGDLNGE